MKKWLIIASALTILAGCSSMRDWGSNMGGTSGMSQSGGGASSEVERQYQREQQQSKFFNSYID